jgi:hypothetical protein
MVLTSKFDIGDVVFAPTSRVVLVNDKCHQCLGFRQWSVVTPAGNALFIDCPVCSAYDRPSRRKVVPSTRYLTVGQVRYENRGYNEGMSFTYMCEETGIGSGTVWMEADLSNTEEAATRIAEYKAAEYQKKLDAEFDADVARRMKNLSKHKKCLACQGTGKVSI